MPLLTTFDELAEGLKLMGGRSALLSLLVIVPLALIAVVTVLRLRHGRLLAAARAEETFGAALRKRALPPDQASLISRLARHAPDPMRKHELLSSPRVFQAALDRARRAESIDEGQIAALRVALGFGTRQGEGTVYSTTEIAAETALIVEQEKVRRFRAKAEAVEAAGITIVTEDGEVPPAVGASLQVYFKREAGVFTFSSRVVSLQGSRARIAHSESISRYQKRQYYRRKLAIPVQVRVAGSEEKPASYRFVDIGGGGASISNPDLRFRPGDDIEITFEPPGGESMELVGEVVRLSEAGKVMHVAFGPLREATRDRIIGYVLNAGAKEQPAKKKRPG